MAANRRDAPRKAITSVGRIGCPTTVRAQSTASTVSGPGARADQWRDLVEAAKAWAGATGGRAKYEALLNDLAVTEEFHGYPGLQLMAALKESAAAGDAATSLALSTRIVQALMTRSFRQHAGDWSVNEDGDGGVPDLLPPAYFRPGAQILALGGRQGCPVANSARYRPAPE